MKEEQLATHSSSSLPSSSDGNAWSSSSFSSAPLFLPLVDILVSYKATESFKNTRQEQLLTQKQDSGGCSDKRVLQKIEKKGEM